MSLLSDIATEHQLQRIRLGQSMAARAGALWSQMDVSELDASWDAIAPRLTAEVVASQVVSATMATPYVYRVGQAAGDVQESAALAPEAFGGLTFDGREAGPAMFGAVTTTKKAIGAGMAPRMAFESGASFLNVMVKALIADMGRAADATLATGKGYTRYVRVVSPGACSRCAILAGSDRFSKPFLRHPACKCTSLPIKDAKGIPEGVFASPEEYFGSLSKAEQDRVFSKAGAESIRLGADPVSVVHAGRGAYMRPARASVRRAAASGVSRGVGDRYRRTVNTRLTPEMILQDARGDQELAKSLLRQNGYLR